MNAAVTTARRAGSVPLPVGFAVVLDDRAREIERGTWVGGAPTRALRIAPAGRAIVSALLAGGIVHDARSGVVARRLVDAGIAHPVPPVSTTLPELTVVVPVYDRADELDRCLRALGHVFPVVVVDDASPTDRAAEVAANHRAHLIRLPTNGGPARARNAGLRTVTTELVAFVDSDTTPSAEALVELAAHLTDPTVAAAAPRIRPTGHGTTLAASYTRARCSLDLGPRAARVRPYSPVSYVPSATLVARTADVRDGFDESLRYGEDVDLIWRLVDAGRTVRYVPSTVVGHQDPATAAGLLSRRYRYGTSAAALAHRHPAKVAPLIVHPWYTAAALALIARRPALAAAATLGAARSARRTLAGKGLPAGAVTNRQVLDAVGQTLVGAARYATQFGTPLLLAGMTRRRTRPSAAALLLIPPIHAWWTTSRSDLGPGRFTVAHLADETAYGAGVMAGAIRHRTLIPLRPARAS